MNNTRVVALAGAILLAVLSTSTGASAQNAQSPPKTTGVAEDDSTIIVTARRKDEALLDVPATVSAVTGKQIEDFQITRFQDLAQLVSGLTLENQQAGFGATASVRGVTFQVTSQGSPTVEQYLNEVPIEPNAMAQSNFDIGQIEVLKGPQGTLRGRSAPSGAITETTRRPDLDSIGGYVSSDITSLNGINVQGALGVPIIKDVLALRVAGVWDENDNGGVRSTSNNSGLPSNPRSRNYTGRATVRFEPTSNFSAVVMYQRLVTDARSYGGALFGTGALGITSTPGQPANTRAATGAGTTCSGTNNCGNPAAFAPPNFNGPALTAGQQMSVQDYPSFVAQRMDLITGQADWHVGGQKLSFIGSYQNFHVLTQSEDDANNSVVGIARNYSPGSNAVEKRQSYELRLASEEPLFDGLLDYTLGGFYLKLYGLSASGGRNTVLMQGAFGSPLGAGTLPGGGTAPGLLSPFTYDRRYAAGYNIQTPRNDIEKSIFGTITLHLFGDKTEFSAGGRQIFRSASKEVDVFGIPGIAAVLNPNGLGACPATLTATSLTGGGTVPAGTPVVGHTYAGTCDVAVNIGNNNGGVVTPGIGAPASLFPSIPFGTRKWSPFVYNFSLSHKITPDLMVYASYGTAWRAGPGPITAAPACADANLCSRYNLLDAEDSKAVEVGFKASLFDKKLNISVAGYRETYSGLFVAGSGATYLPIACANGTNAQTCLAGSPISTGSFTFNAPATTYGIDVDTSLRISQDFNMGVLFSWSHGRYNNANIPCRDTNLDGIADSGALPTIDAWINGINGGGTGAKGPKGPSLCLNNGSSTTAPPWNISGRAEYSHDIFGSNFGGRAFIRTLVNYYPRNTSIDPTVAGLIPNQYALVNLWLGLRGAKGDWELSVSAKNLFNNQTVTRQDILEGTLITPQRNDPFGSPASIASPANSGYRSISMVSRREFAINLRYAFGSH